MKRIVFLIIATLLVLGLVLPGCGGNGVEFENWITIAVAGPMNFIQGRDHLIGAKMAVEEINADGGVMIGTVAYGLKLYPANGVDTNEILDTSGATGETALTAVIDDVDFVVGGFRTEAVDIYRDVAMDAKKIFFDCGAASNELQESVLLDYDTYQYWFKATPYNGTFLFYNVLKQAGSVDSQLRAALNLTDLDPATTAACIVEDAEWTGGFKYKLAPYLIAKVGLNICAATQLPKSDAINLETEMTTITTQCGGEPMMTVTVLSGPPGKAYGMQQGTYLPDTFTVGINVEAQDIDYHHDTGAQYHVEMDTWAEDVALTGNTLDFLSYYMDETGGGYPTYCAATYDVLYTIKAAVEDVGLSSASIITWLEDLDHAQTGTASTTGYYPMPALGPYPLEGPSLENPTGFSGEWYALSYAQAYEIYGDGLLVYYLAKHTINSAQAAGNWTTGLRLMTGFGSSAHLTSYMDNTGPYLPHDTIYGPGWQTGQGAQWQPVDPENLAGEWHKVGWWPMVSIAYPGWDAPAADLTTAAASTLLTYGLLDQWGNWNFAYPGRVPLVIPQDWIDYWD